MAQISPTPDTTTSKGAQPGGDCAIYMGEHSSIDSIEVAHSSNDSADFKGGYTSSKGVDIRSKVAYATLS